MPSVTGLQRYYEDEVVQLHNQLVEDVKRHRRESTVTSAAATPSCGVSVGEDGLGSVPVYLVGSAGDDNIPEIHFPSSEEGVGGAVLSLEHATPQLDAGMQMLQSLEQGSLGGGASGAASAAATPAAAANAASEDDQLALLAAASPQQSEVIGGGSGGTKKRRRH